MIKKKAVLSFLSVLLSGLFMLSLFSSSLYNGTTQADARLDGVSGKIYDFTDKIINKLYEDNSSAQGKEKSKNLNEQVYLGGYPIGLKLYADGVVVVGTEAVDTKQGLINPAEISGIKVGDVIKKIDGKRVLSNNEVSNIIEESQGSSMHFFVERNGEYLNLNFSSRYSESEEKYKAGIWIRDSSAGIGTVTFCTQDGYYASLGHPVCDIDTNQVIPISQGECTDVKLTGYKKGTTGSAGELSGFLNDNSIGDVYYNGEIGVYGRFNDLPRTTLFSLASADEIKTGEAEIYTSLENGVTEKFKIEIVNINKNSTDNKNLTLKVTDPNLINKTGGIIQGMSGSPIVQNGKIVGAVTHVFLNDPQGGYGIFAETMLGNINNLTIDN